MGLFSSSTGRSAADTAKMKAKVDARQKDLARQNKETRKMLQQNVSKRKSGWN